MEKLEDLSKMKVADLKKHLKNKGLSVAGNKTELVERLQQALQSDGNPTLDASAAGEDEEFDEEEILGGDDDDGTKVTQEEEAAALAGIKIKGDAKLLAAKSTDKKRISLKRSQPSLGTKEAPEEPAAADESVVSIPEEDLSSIDKENLTTEEEEPSKHKKIKLSADKDNEKEVLDARAKKFGTVTNETEEGRKSSRAARFGVDASESSPGNKNKRAPKLSMEVGSMDLDALKKRAERFGEVTSKSLSKLEDVEKKKQRQNRFAESEKKGETEADEKKSESETKDVSSDTVKATRAERFGAAKENGTTKVLITAPGNEDDAKKKRAQRFA